MTLDERKSKLRLAAPLQSKKAQEVKQAAITLVYPIKALVKTITFDNGKVLNCQDRLDKQAEVFFTHRV